MSRGPNIQQIQELQVSLVARRTAMERLGEIHKIGPARTGDVEAFQLQMREIRLTVGLDHDCPPEFAARQMAEELERFILREYRKQSLLLPQPGASNDLRRS